MSAVNRIIATNTLCQVNLGIISNTPVLFVLKQLLHIPVCRNMAELLGFNLQRIRLVYFVGQSSISFACVSISVAWVLLLTVKCGKVKLVFYLRVLVLN